MKHFVMWSKSFFGYLLPLCGRLLALSSFFEPKENLTSWFWHVLASHAEPLRLKHLEALKFPGGPYEGMVYKTKSWKLVIAPSQRFSIVVMGKTWNPTCLVGPTSTSKQFWSLPAIMINKRFWLIPVHWYIDRVMIQPCQPRKWLFNYS